MLDEALEHLHSLKPRRLFEITFVDDGSSDRTSDLALKYAHSHPKDEIWVVRLETNRMKGGTVKHGVMHSRGEMLKIRVGQRDEVVDNLLGYYCYVN